AQVGENRSVRFPGYRHLAPPRPERLDRRLADRHQPILVALARSHHHHPEFLVEVAPVESNQLAYAQPRGIQRLNYSAVAYRRRPRRAALGLDQLDDLLLRQDRR